MTDLSPNELLIKLKTIEDNIGRVKSVRNGPRLIDLDIM
jgi:2-amino-4-hydroxy-6-hydroxymethyldihydropteridine diphosphokinase